MLPRILALVLTIGLVLSADTAAAGVEEGVAAFRADDFETALAEFRPAAEAGEAEGQYWMGRLYDAGAGMDEDPETALEWFRKAAD